MVDLSGIVLDHADEEPAGAIPEQDFTSPSRDVLADLRRLIEALDRRVPQIARAGEARIAHEAGQLRARAVSLIGRIERGTPMP